jgi:K+ transporter
VQSPGNYLSAEGTIRFNGKVQRVEAIEAALPVDLSELLLLSRHLLKSAAHSGMPRWQNLPFAGLSRSANDATDYFQIPTGRVVEADHDLGA